MSVHGSGYAAKRVKLSWSLTASDYIVPAPDCVVTASDYTVPASDCIVTASDCVAPASDCVVVASDCAAMLQATYDKASECFIINTPDDTASKFWIGGAGQHGKVRLPLMQKQTPNMSPLLC